MITKAWCISKDFHFNKAAKTSRNTLYHKTSHFIFLEDDNGNMGIGECSPIYGLSIENEKELKQKITEVIYLLNHRKEIDDIPLEQFPSLKFALECAELDLKGGGRRMLFNTPFIRGERSIKINGLIWMSSLDGMREQLTDKAAKGFSCIKIKVGSHDLQSELDFLGMMRNELGNSIEIRLDANGAYSPSEAPGILNRFAEYNIHSIEQPIKAGQWKEIGSLCRDTPIPIALDEELIGIESDQQEDLLNEIKPQYVIFKPSLLGGLKRCDEWIKHCEERNIGWWATSALESNIGLNAIAQWISTYDISMYQGLGTGQIYKDNISSPLYLDGENLYYGEDHNWDISELLP